MKLTLTLSLLPAIFAAAACLADEYVPEEGDIVFQSSQPVPIVEAIEGATESPFSHCGLVFKMGDKWMVVEAVGPVREIPLKAWISLGREGKFAAYRLRKENRRYVTDMIESARAKVGLPYDIKYEMDDEKLYCSELVYKAFKAASGEELGKLVKLGDLKWEGYERLIVQIEGGPVPKERLMITPRAVSEASQLYRVAKYGDTFERSKKKLK